MSPPSSRRLLSLSSTSLCLSVSTPSFLRSVRNYVWPYLTNVYCQQVHSGSVTQGYSATSWFSSCCLALSFTQLWLHPSKSLQSYSENSILNFHRKRSPISMMLMHTLQSTYSLLILYTTCILCGTNCINCSLIAVTTSGDEILTNLT